MESPTNASLTGSFLSSSGLGNLSPGLKPLGGNPVTVAVRVRPFAQREIELEGNTTPTPVVAVRAENPNILSVLDVDKEYAEREAFEFDHVLWSIPRSQWEFIHPSIPVADQSNVFDRIGKDLVVRTMDGYNISVLAYGQTGSGKTHTMMGAKSDEGLIPRLVRGLFDEIKAYTSMDTHMSYSVELSFLEIYNEKVKDLLLISHAGSGPEEYGDCKVRYHPETGTYVEGLRRDLITSAEECLDLVSGAMSYRSVAATKMNAESSRSHAIFQLVFRQKSPTLGTQRTSIVNLVDLAGSERIAMSGVTGQRLVEAKNINLSLSTLRRVIDILIENSKIKKGSKGVPPYRESMLTWILSDTLGGNSVTVMIATASPHKSNIEDTINTLRYALKAKAIVCNAKVNEERTAVVVTALKSEVDELRKKLQAHIDTQNAEGAAVIQKQVEKMEADYAQALRDQEDLRKVKDELEEKLATKNQELSDIRIVLDEKTKIHENVKSMGAEAEKLLQNAKDGDARAVESHHLSIKHEENIQFTKARNKSFIRKTEDRYVKGAVAKLEQNNVQQQVYSRVFRNALQIARYTSGRNELKQSLPKIQDSYNLTNSRALYVRAKHSATKLTYELDFMMEEYLEKTNKLFQSCCEALVKKMDAEERALETYLKDKDSETQFLKTKKAALEKDVAVMKEKHQMTHSYNQEITESLVTKLQAAKMEVVVDLQDKISAAEAALPTLRRKIKNAESDPEMLRTVLNSVETENFRLCKAIAAMGNLDEMVEEEVNLKVRFDQLGKEIQALSESHRLLESRKEATSRNKTDVSVILGLKGYVTEDNVNEETEVPTPPELVQTARVQPTHKWKPSLAEEKRAKHNAFMKQVLYGN